MEEKEVKMALEAEPESRVRWIFGLRDFTVDRSTLNGSACERYPEQKKIVED